MQFNQYDLAQTTLGKQGSSMAEGQIPLWVYSSGAVSNTTGGGAVNLLVKGSTSANGSTTVTGSKIHTLNSTWSPTQKFAFEASIYTQNDTVYAQLMDCTASSLVTGSQISSTSTTAILLRSGTFTLIPGHTYGVALSSLNSGHACYLTKAHLVPILS